MRVLHVLSAPSGLGGAEAVVGHLVREGRRRGLDQLVCNPTAGADDETLRRHFGADTYREHVVHNPWGVAAAWRWLAAVIAREDPDIVHGHLFHAAALLALVPRREEARVLTHHHGAYYRQAGRLLPELADRWATRRFDRIVAVSSSVASYVAGRDRRLDADRIAVIPNGWHGTPHLREQLVEPTILCLARFRPEKGHRILIEAFALLVQRVPSARLRLVGDGPLQASVSAQISAAGLDGRVTLRGPVDDPWPEYAAADVLVVPSTTETFGLVAAEGMAAGLPVVATKIGGLPELIVDGETGVLVPPGDARALADALAALLDDEPRRERMGAAGRARAQLFGADRMARRYFDLYEDLARGSTAAVR